MVQLVAYSENNNRNYLVHNTTYLSFTFVQIYLLRENSSTNEIELVTSFLLEISGTDLHTPV